MAVRAVYVFSDDESGLEFRDGYVWTCGESIAAEDEIDDLIEALQRIKADLARAKGGA